MDMSSFHLAYICGIVLGQSVLSIPKKQHNNPGTKNHNSVVKIHTHTAGPFFVFSTLYCMPDLSEGFA